MAHKYKASKGIHCKHQQSMPLQFKSCFVTLKASIYERKRDIEMAKNKTSNDINLK